MDNMQGHLLIANPLLNDGFFNRSVIYLTAHGEDGSVGFIMNFRTHLLLRDVRPQVKNGNFNIYEGGPVARNQLFFLHRLGNKVSDSFPVTMNISFGGDLNELLALIDKGEASEQDVKFFAGYSGWGEGQLQNEMNNRHWFLSRPSVSSFFNKPAEELWKESLSTVKESYAIFAKFGNDPSLN
jgi:putative transcriptional regulator